VDDLTTAPGIVALVAVALALLALLACLLLALRLRELRAAQQTVLGEGGARDVVAHARDLERSLGGLERHVEEVVARLDGRDTELTTRLDGAVTHCAVVRYDAMGEMTGRQSSSVALLDSHRTGVVLSSILHREQARLYAKQIIEGRSEFELSPEEKEALQTALESPVRS
jgi:NAD(P)-dependent dehydrogenase (short-subunit alcohol dehydrogenase family)